MKFYNTKQVYLSLGISGTTLYKRIMLGHYPALQTGGARKGGKGYFEDMFEIVKTIQTPKNGRPRKA
jgi:hypothetical protein